MNSNKRSATNYLLHLLCISSSAAWGCADRPADVDADILRAGDTSDSSMPSDPPDDPPEGPGDPNDQIPPPDEEGCHAIYAQDHLPTFELTMDEDTWDDLEWEWKNGSKQKKKGLVTDPYHSLDEFRYGDIVITNAEIRLRGNATHWDEDDKLQFHIAFDRVDKQGRFLGLEVVALDAATANRHMLRDRLALSIMRDMGVIATCANNARVVINGEYYGIFTNLEKLDKVFLERAFEDPSGDLWQRHDWDLETNKKSANDDRIDALKDADSIEELETYLDVEQALTVYAAEAIMPDSDGGWAGGLNFFFYDDPLSGKFKLLPWDLDSTFDRFDDGENGEYPDNPDPVVWSKKERNHGRPWYDLAIEDEDWFWVYIDTIKTQFEAAYDVAVLHEKIDTWTDQIKESVLEDDNKPWSNNQYLDEVEDLKAFVEARHDWMVEWLECWEEGGEPDKKGYCKD
jgi:CotH kinase protein